MQPSDPPDELKRLLQEHYGDGSKPILEGNGPYPCCPSNAQLKIAIAALQEIERIASLADPDNVSRTWQEIAAIAFRGQSL